MPDSSFSHIFDPQKISNFLKVASEALENYLSTSGRKGVNLPSPHILLREVHSLTRPEQENEKDFSSPEDHLRAIIDLHLKTSIHVHSTGYMGRQFSSVPPAAAVYDFISAMAPQPATFYECGPLANAADKVIAKEFGKFLAWEPNTFDMISTSGGSLANLTAVLAARNLKLKNSWEHGLVQHETCRRPAIAIGEDSHFSVERIAGILGIGQDAIIRLPLNEKRQICSLKARETLTCAQRKGLNVFCIIATAGTTSVGAIDPIQSLSQLAVEFDAWLHVDAAHGGALLVSDTYRKNVVDLRYADSFSLDAHKMLFSPAACTLLFYRNKQHATSPFPTQASYVLDDAGQEIRDFENGTKNFECTKRPSILNLWVIWCLYGREFFEKKINRLLSVTKIAHNIIKSSKDFSTINNPEINIMCFRYEPNNMNEEDTSSLQKKIWRTIRSSNEYFISKVDIDGITALRLVIMNHNITEEDIRGLLQRIREICHSTRENS